MVWSKLHCRKNESLQLLWALPLPGTCIFSGLALSDHRGRETECSMSKTKSQTFHLFLSFLTLLSALFLLLPLCVSVSLSLSSFFLDREESRGDWLVRLELRGRRGPGHRAYGVCKAGRFPWNAALNVPKAPHLPTSNPPLLRSNKGREVRRRL